MAPDNANDTFSVLQISKQAKRTKNRRAWPIRDTQCRLKRGLCQRLWFIHYSFMCLMAVTRQFVLIECKKPWTTWSLVNSRTQMTCGKMLLRQDRIMKLLLLTMTLMIKDLKTNILKENVLVKADTFIATSGSTKQHFLRNYHDLAWGWTSTRREWFPQTRWEIPCHFHRTSCCPRCPSEIILLLL